MAAKLIVISGGSGSGQSLVINALMDKHPDWQTVSSYTTREPRVDERDSKKYFFVSEAEFKQKEQAGEILEAEEYAGHWYGTSKQSLAEAKASAPVVILGLQIKGYLTLKQQYPELIGIYLQVDLADAAKRFDSDEHRVKVAATERQARLDLIAQLNAQSDKFDYVINSQQNQQDKVIKQVEEIISA